MSAAGTTFYFPEGCAFLRVPLWALDAIRRLDDGEKFTYSLAIYAVHCELANAARSSTYEASRTEIAKKAGVSPRTVDGHNRDLERAGVLTVERRSREREKLRNRYSLVLAPTEVAQQTALPLAQETTQVEHDDAPPWCTTTHQGDARDDTQKPEEREEREEAQQQQQRARARGLGDLRFRHLDRNGSLTDVPCGGPFDRPAYSPADHWERRRAIVIWAQRNLVGDLYVKAPVKAGIIEIAREALAAGRETLPTREIYDALAARRSVPS
jgi:DNA-binding transcriptional ArsR family regulator